MAITAQQGYPVVPAPVALAPSTVEPTRTVTVTLSASVANWTPGTPGAPAFIVSPNAGTVLASQQVTSADKALLTLITAAVVGPVILTDPLNGYSYTLAVGGHANF